mmetsp:Transcript_140364/g.269200  ORF Transcript_140364/g.269200 Transcript_140364/m.269200 type:complete len:265 (+) Transcript_140364:83-877(+)
MSLSNTGKHVLNSWVTIQTFEELDKNGDEQLDFDEMKGLLRARNPHMKEPDLRFLYNGIDSSHDGFVDLEEFVKFYLASEASDHKGVSSEASDHKSEPKPEMEEPKETKLYGLPNMSAPIPSIQPFKTRTARSVSTSCRRQRCGPTILDGTGFQDSLRHSMYYEASNSTSLGRPAFAAQKPSRSKTPTSLQPRRPASQSRSREVSGPERFFYDRSTYTGVHQHGGPSCIDGNGWVSSMRAGHHSGSTFTRTAGHPLNNNGPRCI